MIFGPFAHADRTSNRFYLIQTYGLPTVLDGKPGFLPIALIFQVGALLGLLALLPLLY